MSHLSSKVQGLFSVALWSGVLVVSAASSQSPGSDSATPTPSGSQAPAASQAIADAVTAARAAALRIQEQDRLPGLQVAVQLGGRLVWSEGLGFADRKRQTPVTTETMFRIGSVSKSLTSVALGRLVEERLLDLDLPVQQYAPAFPAKEWVLTTRLVAGHLSGLPHYSGGDFVNKKHYESVVEALDKFKDRPLLFEPGTRLSYSSYGWNLIGAVLEGASGSGFLELMRSSVFEPLGLSHTVADRSSEIPDRAIPYGVFGPLTITAPKIDNSDAWPSAGFLSTAEDLVRLGNAMLHASYLSKQTVELLWTPLQTADGSTTDYGLGWQLREIAGQHAVGHGGSHVGATADLWIVPALDLILAVVTNTNSEHLSQLPVEIVRGVAAAGDG